MSTITYPSLKKLDGLKFRFEDAEFDITMQVADMFAEIVTWAWAS